MKEYLIIFAAAMLATLTYLVFKSATGFHVVDGVRGLAIEALIILPIFLALRFAIDTILSSRDKVNPSS